MGVDLGHHILSIVWGRAGSMQAPWEDLSTSALGPARAGACSMGHLHLCPGWAAAGSELRFLGMELALFETCEAP